LGSPTAHEPIRFGVRTTTPAPPSRGFLGQKNIQDISTIMSGTMPDYASPSPLQKFPSPLRDEVRKYTLGLLLLCRLYFITARCPLLPHNTLHCVFDDYCKRRDEALWDFWLYRQQGSFPIQSRLRNSGYSVSLLPLSY
jgi:hypothetical protein